MADITFLHGFNRSDGINQLIAGYGGDIQRFEDFNDSWNGMFQPIDLTARGKTTTFLDYTFWVNGLQNNKRYNGLVWTDETTVKKAPIAKTIFAHPTQKRIFLGDVTYGGTRYASRFWMSDLPKNNDITYGLEHGMDLRQIANGKVVKSNGAYFITRNIKVGDPFLITTGPNIGEYRVESVDAENQITLTTPLINDFPASSYWVGGNFVDVVTNNNDVLKGFTDFSEQLLVFKLNSLYRYSNSQLKRIKGVPGTWTQDSIVNIKDFCYYFHNTGIWRTDAASSTLISRPVQDYIDGIDPAFYPYVVSWKVDETYRIFIGNVNNTKKNIHIENCILDFDTITNSWSPGKLPVTITASTTFIEDNVENIYLGTDQGQVFKDNTGNNDNGNPIPWMVDLGWHFPASPEVISEYTRMLIFCSEGRGLSVGYQLYGTPEKHDKQIKRLGDIEDEVTEIKFKNKRDIEVLARGIRPIISGSSKLQSPTIDRVVIFYKPKQLRNI